MKYLWVLLIILISVSCKDLTKENQELRNELRNMEYELGSMEGSPGCMLGNAFEILELGKVDSAVVLLKEVKESFPEWNEQIMDKLIELVEEEKTTGEKSKS